MNKLLIGKDRMEELFQHIGVDEAEGRDKTVFSVRDAFGGMKIMPVPDSHLRRIVDPVPPSRHRSKRILKKLRKRLGEPYEEDFMLMLHEKMMQQFALHIPDMTHLYSGQTATKYEVDARSGLTMKRLNDVIMRHGAILGGL